jgi:hypothetical protein
MRSEFDAYFTLSLFISVNKDVHAYNTRQRDDLYVSSHTLFLSKSNPHACMANLYNMLPVSLKNEQSIKLYLKMLKAFVYEDKFYDFAEFKAFVAK